MALDISELQRMAEAGSVPAQVALGVCFLDGIGSPPNYPEAFRLLSIGAARGAPRAILNLARMYALGLGVDQDLPKAYSLFHAAANAGEFFAKIALARMYKSGYGVSRDASLARHWYEQAVHQAEQQEAGPVGGELREARVSYLRSGWQRGDIAKAALRIVLR